MKEEIIGNRCLLLGYGREGKSVHKFLLRNTDSLPQALEISIADRGTVSPEPSLPAPKVIMSGEHYLEGLSSFTTIIRSPGIPYRLPEIQIARENGVHLSSLSNLFFSIVRGRVIGVTGTKGKSTTSSLLFHLLSSRDLDVRLVGNIGVPALDLLDDHDEDTVFVVELSSFQLEDLRYSPHISVFLDVFEEHLDHHGSFQAYLDAKLNILAHQSQTDTAIFQSQHPFRQEIDNALRSRAVIYCVSHSTGGNEGTADFVLDSNLRLSHQSSDREAIEIDLSKSPLKGRGNVRNVVAASLAALTFDTRYAQTIETALSSYRPLPHRLEFVGCHQQIDFYNDSLATIPQATESAVSGLGDRVQTLILGGFDRGISYKDLARFLLGKRGTLKNLILFPTTGERIWHEIEAISASEAKDFTKIFVSNMQEAVEAAFRLTEKKHICLLSPASSSLNMFRDYQDRGDQFRREVERAR